MVATTSGSEQLAVLHDRLAGIGRGFLAPLTAQMRDARHLFATAAVAAGRRTVDEALDARQAQLARLADDLRRRGAGDETPTMPLCIQLIVRPE